MRVSRPMPLNRWGWGKGHATTYTLHAHMRTFWLIYCGFKHQLNNKIMIDDNTIRRINDAVNILDVISDFKPDISKAGVNYQCLCPFHNDRHKGSFTISPKKNMCYCFSCEKGGDAVYYLMEGQGMSYPDALRYLGQKYGIEVEGSEKFKKVPKAKPRDYQIQVDNLPVFTLPLSMYERSTKHLSDDVLVRWLYEHKWDAVQHERIDKVLRAYRVGTMTTDHNEQFTIFWYSDETGNLCTGKMIRYKYNGHRMKKGNGITYVSDWIHAWLYRSPVSTYYDRDRVDWKRTYFGMHLVDRCPNATINIVESEKTALIMSIAYGDAAHTLWLACGSKTNLTRDKLLPLIERHRYIVLYPDRDAVEAWRDTAQSIGYGRMTVNSDPVLKWWREGDGPKADIADVVLRMIDGSPDWQPKSIGDIINKNPNIRKLIDRLDLKPIDP